MKRRQPKQRRARQTVDAILDAVLRVLERHGLAAVTTNRIADAAGVSIGSVYQYFPDKGAIFLALHERHVGDVERIIDRTLVAHADAPLETLLRALVHALIDEHARNPQLHELLLTVPRRSDGRRDLGVHLRGALRLAIAAHERKRPSPRELDRVLFVISNQIDALCHAAVQSRPSRLSLAAAEEETVRAVLAYLRAELPSAAI